MSLWNKEHPWVSIYYSAKYRCDNKNNKAYKWYGGRGIKFLLTVDKVKQLWFRDKAYKMMQHSIDRKENNGDYVFENCRFIELAVNTAKDKIKSINQYDLQGNFVRSWKSGREIQRTLGFNQSNICKVCLGKRKTAYDFVWNYK